MKTTIVTGAAGFIGYHVAERLLGRGDRVVGLDSLNAYYDPSLKMARLQRLRAHANFEFVRCDLADKDAVKTVFAEHLPTNVVNLAAQAGVRHSLTHPEDYIDSNIVGFLNILEGCRHHGVAHLVYASSSSVYGGNTRMPFSELHGVDHPLSLYAATKRANELMAHAYSHLYGLPTTGLRFFTAYGPWGRPDMALYLFTQSIMSGAPLQLFNGGRMSRDFSFIDDVVEGVVRVLDRPAASSPSSGPETPPHRSDAPFVVYNIGNNTPCDIMHAVRLIERELGLEARFDLLPMQPGDVPSSAADASELERDFGPMPHTPIEIGLPRFVAWARDWIARGADAARMGP